MGSFPSERASGVSIQQLSRQVQVAVTDALRTLDAARAIDQASQEEVDSLRSVIWTELTGLESEFGREEGPRAEALNRFFNHLLSNGDYIGQIETLAGALLGGAPPPSQPEPDSPVAGLFKLHRTLVSVRRQWQESASKVTSRPVDQAALKVTSRPVDQAAPLAPAASPAKQETISHSWNEFYEEMGFIPSQRQEMPGERAPRGRALAERPPAQPARMSGSERLLDGLGFGVPRTSDVDAPRPRVFFTFIAVFVILAGMGVGVIFLGLNGGSQNNTGSEPSVIPTFSLTIPAQTQQPTPTLSSAAPQLVITGNPLIVPCPGRGSSGFLLKNAGGQVLTWSAKVNRVGNSVQPVALDVTSGSLYGSAGSGTDSVSVNVTANVGNLDGTITITTNIPGAAGTKVITYRIHGC